MNSINSYDYKSGFDSFLIFLYDLFQLNLHTHLIETHQFNLMMEWSAFSKDYY